MRKPTMTFISYQDHDYRDLAIDVCSTVYFHGKLEDKFNYDCCGVCEIDKKYIKTVEMNDGKKYDFLHINGVYDVNVKDVDEPCIGFFWTINQGDNFILQKGLICLKSDEEYVNDAKAKYEKKVTFY